MPPVSGYERVLCVVETFQKAVVQRQSGAQDGTYDHFVFLCGALFRSQRCFYSLVFVFECFGQFVTQYFAYASQIVAETHAVLLYIDVPKACDVSAQD